jgi:ATP-dependent DNA ligase
VPHSLQNFAPAAYGVPHEGQPRAIGAPHSEQNLASSALVVPHREQFIRFPSDRLPGNDTAGAGSVARVPVRTIADGLPAPMLALAREEIPRGEGWTYEPKWDGFRAIVAVRDGAVTLASRNGRPLGRYFIELEGLLGERAAGVGFVADGEIVIVQPGSMDFGLLQLRLHPAASRVAKLAGEIPATLILFDLLRETDEDLTSLPLAERRERLAALAGRLRAAEAPTSLADIAAGPALSLGPWTEDLSVAEAWFADDAGIGQDGIVAKRVDQAYQPGVRGWVKVKHRTAVDCVVGGYRLAKGGDGVGSLLLGLYDGDGTLHYVGHTSSFKAAERREMIEVLAPLVGGKSFRGMREPGGQSRWSSGKDLDWVSLEPVLVAEVSFDRIQDGRMRHAATFLRWRQDRDPASCTWDQLGLEPPSWSWSEDHDTPAQGS